VTVDVESAAVESDSPVLLEVTGSVAVITINRPKQRNAIDLLTSVELAKALTELDARNDLTVGVLTGAGGNFSAGMDLKAFARGEKSYVNGRGFAGLVEAPPAKPLIAAIEGWALGGGFEIALACDMVVAGASAQFGLPEVRRGLVPRAGGALRLPRRIPYALAMEIILTGAPLDASRAERLGLVSQIAPDGDSLAVALELATIISGNAPLALVAAKRVVRESAGWPDEEAFERQRVIIDPVFVSEDALEGVRAFRQGRPPQWRGH
jgi:enoyl-CoA hydratase